MENFDSKPKLPKGIIYDRRSGGVDGNDSGSAPMDRKVGVELDDAGFQTDGFQNKKGTPFVMGAQIGTILNTMPPGMFIDNQQIADIREMPYKQIVDAEGYPGDGWRGTPTSATDKVGR